MDFSKFTPAEKYPHPTEFVNLIEVFRGIQISIKDITNEEQLKQHQKVVEATYHYNGRSYVSKPLFYKNVLHAPNVKSPRVIADYFEDDVYWLDIEVHDWPKPSGETDIDNLIINDITDDEGFKSLLKLLANNHSNGLIQRITQHGRSSQYYRNLENNNHWHDLIILIQQVISKGKIDKEYFKPLVFKWDGNKNTDRLRASLSPHFGDRSLVSRLIENINKYKIVMDQDIMIDRAIELLKYKKQIILQGPPGTGKTRLAKQIARKLTSLSYKDIANYLKVGDVVNTFAGDSSYKIDSIQSYNITLTGDKHEKIKFKKISFDKILECFHTKRWLSAIKNGDDRGACALAYHLYTIARDQSNIKILQFHPSYSYEDFVRGIVSKSNDAGDGIIYESEDKILAKFAKEALENYNASNRRSATLQVRPDVFDAFIDQVKDDLTQSEEYKYSITDAVYLFSADEKRFKYKGDNWVAHKNGLNMKFSELKKIIDADAKERKDIKKMTEVEELTRQHATYFMKVIEKFNSFKDSYGQSVVTRDSVSEKNYVLIIDEINRANLSSVLGELIYTLEYRGESVESMYEVDGENNLVLPPNLYIIGTMNTADRSVGHIDYAIRRRFAFVDVLPKDLSEEEGIHFDKELFEKVATLFESNLSPEFEKQEVQLGHSYFIQRKQKDENGNEILVPTDFNIRLEYEIKPILLEYVKDGILVGTDIKGKILELQASI